MKKEFGYFAKREHLEDAVMLFTYIKDNPNADKWYTQREIGSILGVSEFIVSKIVNTPENKKKRADMKQAMLMKVKAKPNKAEPVKTEKNIISVSQKKRNMIESKAKAQEAIVGEFTQTMQSIVDGIKSTTIAALDDYQQQVQRKLVNTQLELSI